jgi:membrane protease YdiL (CAAX protease family)
VKGCDYCGRENEDVSVFCGICGTLLDPPVIPVQRVILAPPIITTTPELPGLAPIPPIATYEVPPLSPPTPRVLGGGIATAVFGIYLGGQFIAGTAIGFISAFLTGIQHGSGTASLSHTMREMLPFTIFLCMVLSGIGLFASAFGFKIPLRDASPTGAAWVRGRWRDMAVGLGLGILVAALWTILFKAVSPDSGSDGSELLGPMSTLRVISQVLSVISIVFLAPPIEEMLFRGIMFGGYRKSLGTAWAGALTTVIFIAMHFDRFIRSPIAIVGISSLALVALMMRMRTNAIGPSISVHFGYNAFLVLTSLYFS